MGADQNAVQVGESELLCRGGLRQLKSRCLPRRVAGILSVTIAARASDGVGEASLLLLRA